MSGRFMRVLLIACGTLCVALGVIGIFLPLMPTTVFLLLAAACYARSSERFHQKLVTHPVLGPYVRMNRGMPRRAKVVALVLLWCGIGATAIWTATSAWLRLLLLGIAVGVTVHVVRLPATRVVVPDSDRARV